jgi:hypothetical protein
MAAIQQTGARSAVMVTSVMMGLLKSRSFAGVMCRAETIRRMTLQNAAPQLGRQSKRIRRP